MLVLMCQPIKYVCYFECHAKQIYKLCSLKYYILKIYLLWNQNQAPLWKLFYHKRSFNGGGGRYVTNVYLQVTRMEAMQYHQKERKGKKETFAFEELISAINRFLSTADRYLRENCQATKTLFPETISQKLKDLLQSFSTLLNFY
jgi:hypothetical protein